MAVVPSYSQAIQSNINAFTPISVIRNFLSEKVTQIAGARLRDMGAPAIHEEVSFDFAAAVEEFGDVEKHVFHIQAPPSLSPAALDNPILPISLNQSILRHSVRSSNEILSIAKVFHIEDSIRGLVPLTTERLVLHNLVRRFVLNYSLKGELSQELVKVIKPLTQRILRERFNYSQKLRGQIEDQVLLYLETRNCAGMSENLRQSVEDLLKQTQSEPAEVSEKEIYQAISKRTADLVVETYVKQVVDGYDLSQAPELDGYKLLPSQTSETRRVFMINGGVASGKSSAQAMEAERAQADGVEWEDVCPINRDAFKPLLLSQADVESPYKHFFASFTEDEAYLMRDAILRDYRQRLIDDTAPHLYIDQVSPTFEMMQLAAKPDSRGLDLTVVYTPVEASLLMAHNREKATGYVAVTKGVLNTHANVPSQLLQSLEKARKEGCSNIRLRIVANVAPGLIAPMATIDFSKRKGAIQDMDRLLLFFHKMHVNRDAEQFKDLYPLALASPKECCVNHVQNLIRGIEVEGV